MSQFIINLNRKMIKILLLFKKFIPQCFFKESAESLCLTGKDKLFHALQVVTVKVLPPSVSRLYLGEVKLKLQYLVCLLWMLLFNLSRSFR